MMHKREECKHGVLVSTCRCPSKDIRVTIVPCPDRCKKGKEEVRERSDMKRKREWTHAEIERGRTDAVQMFLDWGYTQKKAERMADRTMEMVLKPTEVPVERIGVGGPLNPLKETPKTPAQGGCPMKGCKLVHTDPPIGASIMRHYDKEHIEANRLEREVVEKHIKRGGVVGGPLAPDGYPSMGGAYSGPGINVHITGTGGATDLTDYQRRLVELNDPRRAPRMYGQRD